MQIGQLAKLAGVSVDTVRYYERHGVLPRPQRQSSGYRAYGPDDVRRLNFVRRAKELGFKLDEARQLLALSAADVDISRVKEAAGDRLRDVESRIAELTRIRDGLKQLVEACPGHGGAEACPILAALDGDRR